MIFDIRKLKDLGGALGLLAFLSTNAFSSVDACSSYLTRVADWKISHLGAEVFGRGKPLQASSFTVDQLLGTHASIGPGRVIRVSGKRLASGSEIATARKEFGEAIGDFKIFAYSLEGHSNDPELTGENRERLAYFVNELIKAASRYLEATHIPHEVAATAFKAGGYVLKLRISEEGPSPLNRLANEVKSEYRTHIFYSPSDLLAAGFSAGKMSAKRGAFLVSQGGKTGEIIASDRSILGLNAQDPALVHELTHAKNWFNQQTGKASPFYGYAKSVRSGSALPGAGELYASHISFDEVEAFRREIDLDIQEVREAAEKNPDLPIFRMNALRGHIEGFSQVLDRVGKIADLLQAAVSSRGFNAEDSDFEFGNPSNPFSGTAIYVDQDGWVKARIRISQEKGALRDRVAPFNAEIPLLGSREALDRRNFAALSRQIGALKRAVYQQQEVGSRWLKISSELSPELTSAQLIQVCDKMMQF